MFVLVDLLTFLREEALFKPLVDRINEIIKTTDYFYKTTDHRHGRATLTRKSTYAIGQRVRLPSSGIPEIELEDCGPLAARSRRPGNSPSLLCL